MEISGKLGSVVIDLRMSGPVGDRIYTANVVPLTEDIGDGPFTLRVRSGEGAERCGRRWTAVALEQMDAVAEVAELVVVRRDLMMQSVADEPRDDEAEIGLHPWFDAVLRSTQAELEWVAISHMQSQATIPRLLFDQAELAAEQDADRPRAFTLARMAFIAGDFARTVKLLEQARAKAPDDPAILAQITAMAALRTRLQPSATSP